MRMLVIGACALAALVAAPAMAQKQYGPGVTDTSIKLGNTGPYSGPVSAASSVSKSLGAYFDMVNAEGGINGRKVEYISLDDGYQPPKTVEATRRLVESDQVLAMVGSVGTPAQLAVRKYLNDRQVPQLLLATGAAPFFDAKGSPWSIANQTSNAAEGRIFAKYLGRNMKGAKVAVLVQNDDFGKEFLRGFKEGLPAEVTIAETVSFETSDPSVGSQIVTLRATNAEVLALFATQKAAAQGIRGAREAGWNAKIYVPSIIASVAAVLQPAGLDNSKGVITATTNKDPTDPRFAKDPDVAAYVEWFKKYNSKLDLKDSAAIGGYSAGFMMTQILKEAGDNLTRQNIMRLVANLHGVHSPMMLDGITANTTPDDYNIIKQMQFQVFNGTSWDHEGGIVGE